MSTEGEDQNWDCKVDGHEYEKQGDYDPDTNSYPYLKCIFCGNETVWNLEDDDYEDYV